MTFRHTDNAMRDRAHIPVSHETSYVFVSSDWQRHSEHACSDYAARDLASSVG